MVKGAEEVQDESITEEDDFGDAFDEAIAEEGGEEDSPTNEAEELEGEAEEEEPTPKEEEEGIVEEKPADEKEEKEVPAESQEDDTVETLDQVNHKLSTLGGMYNSEIKRREKLEEEVALLREGKEPNPTAEDQEEPKDEDSTLLTDALMDKISNLDSVKALEEEYDEGMPKALKDIAGLIIEQVKGDFEGQFGKFNEALKPLHADHARTAGEAHFNAVEEAHPDFEELGGELEGWIKTKPAYMRPALENVFKDGSAADVIDLFATFKDEKGYSKSEEIEKDPEEKIDQDKLEDMETVEIRKSPFTSGKKGGASKDDYDAAWDEAN